MAGSKLELFRIGVYIFFPVAVFYFFNNPEFYDEYVVRSQRKLYPKDEDLVKLPKTREGMDALRKKFLDERQKQQEE
ncbi:protein PET100 homolog, mitochondrial-like [Clytia hemisphaerica]|uniref:protein PET100 homolog, mitochondrial-like n=1 Tax=Clytia hemisphaerica TaxID=252671 RepID=UPI0034D42B2F